MRLLDKHVPENPSQLQTGARNPHSDLYIVHSSSVVISLQLGLTLG